MITVITVEGCCCRGDNAAAVSASDAAVAAAVAAAVTGGGDRGMLSLQWLLQNVAAVAGEDG